MILPDANALIYAFQVGAPQHERHAEWLQELVDRGSGLVLCDHVITGFVRIVTNPRIISPAVPVEAALEFVRWLVETPGAQWLSSSAATWKTFEQISQNDKGVRGGLVADAYLAALCIAHGVAIATSDRDFARFDGLRRVDPAAVVKE